MVVVVVVFVALPVSGSFLESFDEKLKLNSLEYETIGCDAFGCKLAAKDAEHGEAAGVD